ncbi:MAG: hypothetical protein AB7P40_06940, partial [Chloroflexota bacterium]
MCAACGIATHIVESQPAAAVIALPPGAGAATASAAVPTRPPAAKFAALRHPDCRMYLLGTMLS